MPDNANGLEFLLPLNPYKGLMPYEEADARFFFGREVDCRIIASNLRAVPVTVVYGESGVGKSSLLRAGVAPVLRSDSEFRLVVCHSWRDDAADRVFKSILDAYEHSPADAQTRWDEGQLDGILISAPAKLLVILDQFEEYFQYHPTTQDDDRLGELLTHLLHTTVAPANLLISIREDNLSLLDRFKGQIPNILENYYRIRHLTRRSAKEAILKPIEQYNRLVEPENRVRLDMALADEVIEELTDTASVDLDRVETSYLQLVMTTWWDRQMAEPSPRVFRKETLESLGGAAHIYRNHFKKTMNDIGPRGQDAAAKLFKQLVTPAGRKTAQTVFELSENTFVDTAVVRNVLEELRNARIVTTVPIPGSGLEADQCYEFTHDVVAKAALAWQRDIAARQRSYSASAKSADRRYQVYISSTFRDQASERKAAIEAVFSMGHIPIALERFSPASKADREVIKAALTECQIFLLIVGARYGDLVPGSEISFVESEYDLALEAGLVVLAFVLDSEEVESVRKRLSPGNPSDRNEIAHQKHYDNFLARLREHFRQTYSSGHDFKFDVVKALYDTLPTIDRPGFVRESFSPKLLEASHNEFIVSIVSELRGFQKLFDRTSSYVEIKRELSRFFVDVYLDRIRRQKVNLFLESGSTVAFVAKELARHLSGQVSIDESGVPTQQIATNNVFAYLILWLVARIPCVQFPWSPPEERGYGSWYGSLIELRPRVPDYPRAPLDAEARRAIDRLLNSPFGPTSMRGPTLLLGSASGLRLSQSAGIKFPKGLPEIRQEEISSELRLGLGPTVGSYHNKVFKRYLYATGLPLVIFLTGEKIDAEFEAGQTHFVLDTELTWQLFSRDHPLAFCVGCVSQHKDVYIKKFQDLGFSTIEADTYSVHTAFMARNAAFIREFEHVVSAKGAL